MALYRSSDYKTSFKSSGLLAQEKKFNIGFQDDHLGFPIRFWSTSHLDPSNEVSAGLFIQDKKVLIDFQHGY